MLESTDAREAQQRQAAIDRYARLMRDGQVERDWLFGFTPVGGETVSITTEVLRAAGAQTEEERVKRIAHRETRLVADIEGELQIQMDHLLGAIYHPHFRGEDFEWDEDAEDTNEFVIIRKKDGRKFRIENVVNVEEITES